VIGVGLTAELIVGVLFGEKWSGAAPLVGILAIYGLIRTAATGGFSLLLAMGRPKFLSFLALVRFVVLVPTALWGAHVAGPYGVAWAVVASSGLRLFLLFIIQARLLNVGFAAYANVLWRCVVSSMAMASGLIVMIWKLPSAETFFDKASHLTLLVVLGAVIYLTTSFTLWVLSGRPNQAEGRIFSLIWGTIGQKLNGMRH
jgi:O-antigen/teichoic acid export membrane protein